MHIRSRPPCRPQPSPSSAPLVTSPYAAPSLFVGSNMACSRSSRLAIAGAASLLGAPPPQHRTNDGGAAPPAAVSSSFALGLQHYQLRRVAAPMYSGCSFRHLRLQLTGTMVVARRSTVPAKKACCSQQNGLRLPAKLHAGSSTWCACTQRPASCHCSFCVGRFQQKTCR